MLRRDADTGIADHDGRHFSPLFHIDVSCTTWTVVFYRIGQQVCHQLFHHVPVGIHRQRFSAAADGNAIFLGLDGQGLHRLLGHIHQGNIFPFSRIGTVLDLR